MKKSTVGAEVKEKEIALEKKELAQAKSDPKVVPVALTPKKVESSANKFKNNKKSEGNSKGMDPFFENLDKVSSISVEGSSTGVAGGLKNKLLALAKGETDASGKNAELESMAVEVEDEDARDDFSDEADLESLPDVEIPKPATV